MDHSLNRLIASWNGFPVFIRITFVVAIVSLLSAILSIVSLYIAKLVTVFNEALRTRLRKQIRQIIQEDVMMGSLDGSTDNSKAVGKLNQLLQTRKFARRVLVEELVQFRATFSGDIAEQLRAIYLDLGLHHEAIGQLSERSWKKVSQGLLELFRMEVPLERGVLLGLTENDNRYIKEIARWYVIKLSDEAPLRFLENIHEPILPWEELEIFKLFIEKPGFVLPLVDHVIRNSTEPTVIALAMKLAAHYEQYEAIPAILDALHHEDRIVRLNAVNALGILKAVTAEDELIAIYPHEDEALQEAILETLGEIGSGHYLDFIEKELTQSESFEVRKSASKALVSQINNTSRIIDRLLSGPQQEVRKLLKHFLNPKISRI